MAAAASDLRRVPPGVDLSECLQYPDFSVVALYRKVVVGFGFMVPDVKYSEAYISFLLVHPEWRRAGIGTFMIYHLIQVSPAANTHCRDRCVCVCVSDICDPCVSDVHGEGRDAPRVGQQPGHATLPEVRLQGRGIHPGLLRQILPSGQQRVPPRLLPEAAALTRALVLVLVLVLPFQFKPLALCFPCLTSRRRRFPESQMNLNKLIIFHPDLIKMIKIIFSS